MNNKKALKSFKMELPSRLKILIIDYPRQIYMKLNLKDDFNTKPL